MCWQLIAQGQEASRPRAFSFLEQPAFARAAALGQWVAATPSDATGWMQNPALADTATAGNLALAYNPYFAGIKNMQLAYQHRFSRAGLWMFGVQGINYGDFQGYDAAGNPTAPFRAGEYAVSLGRAFYYRQYTFGANLKWVNSRLSGEGAAALLTDVGVRIDDPDKHWVAGLTLRNLGVSLKKYSGAEMPLPLQIMAGISIKPQHAPFRLSLTVYDLQQPFQAYQDSYSPNNKEAVGTVDKLFRHVALGVDFLPAKAVAIRAGYNHRMRQELQLPDAPDLSGFSLGFAIKTQRFTFEFTRAFAHAAGGRNYLTLSSDLNTFLQ